MVLVFSFCSAPPSQAASAAGDSPKAEQPDGEGPLAAGGLLGTSPQKTVPVLGVVRATDSPVASIAASGVDRHQKAHATSFVLEMLA